MTPLDISLRGAEMWLARWAATGPFIRLKRRELGFVCEAHEHGERAWSVSSGGPSIAYTLDAAFAVLTVSAQLPPRLGDYRPARATEPISRGDIALLAAMDAWFRRNQTGVVEIRRPAVSGQIVYEASLTAAPGTRPVVALGESIRRALVFAFLAYPRILQSPEAIRK